MYRGAILIEDDCRFSRIFGIRGNFKCLDHPVVAGLIYDGEPTGGRVKPHLVAEVSPVQTEKVVCRGKSGIFGKTVTNVISVGKRRCRIYRSEGPEIVVEIVGLDRVSEIILRDGL